MSDSAYTNETEDGREMTHYCNEQQDSMVLDCGCEFRQSDCGQGGVDFLWCERHGTKGDAAFEAMQEALRDAQALLDMGADTLADDRLGTEPHALMDTMTDAAMDARKALAEADEVTRGATVKIKQAQYATDKTIDLLENALLYTKDKSLDDLPCSNFDASGFLLPAARDCIAEAVKQLRAVRESLKRSEGK